MGVGTRLTYVYDCSHNEMFKLALANASRHVLLRSCYESILHFLSMNNAMGKLQGRGIVCTF